MDTHGSRKAKLFTIETPGRDQGKVFRLEEMAALRGEKWAWRAWMAIQRAGGEVTDYQPGGGWQQLAAAGFQSLGRLEWHIVEPLLDELLTCVSRIEDPARPDIKRSLVESDVDEIATFVVLRAEVFMLHANFSTADTNSTSMSASRTTQEQSSPNIATSRPSSVPSFHRAKRRTANSQPSSA